jgi:hypothetical protein
VLDRHDPTLGSRPSTGAAALPVVDREPAPVVFDTRFAGATPGHANGGVIAGTLAHTLGADAATVEVRLARPVPLGTPLDVVTEGEQTRLCLEGEVLVSAHVTADALPEPAPVSTAEARDTEEVVSVANHPAPGCFVCGPGLPGGLDLQPGRVTGRALVATTWTPPAELAEPDGALPAAIVWAALDCPSWYGAAEGKPALLGTVRGRQVRPVLPGAELVVSGWSEGVEGRKTFAGSAIHRADGDLLAVASSIWIHPTRHP